jgi:nucleoside diphosphate kinase
MFSRTGLRIVGTKIFRFSLNQALEFYGPVDENIEKALIESIGIECAIEEFRTLVEFMSGIKPGENPSSDTDKPGTAKCMILIYQGEDAVKKIREVLGPTDPQKATGGTVRRDFGTSIMINTAHASDSKESYEREKDIVRINENSVSKIISDYLKKQN